MGYFFDKFGKKENLTQFDIRVNKIDFIYRIEEMIQDLEYKLKLYKKALKKLEGNKKIKKKYKKEVKKILLYNSEENIKEMISLLCKYIENLKYILSILYKEQELLKVKDCISKLNLEEFNLDTLENDLDFLSKEIDFHKDYLKFYKELKEQSN